MIDSSLSGIASTTNVASSCGQSLTSLSLQPSHFTPAVDSTIVEYLAPAAAS